MHPSFKGNISGKDPIVPLDFKIYSDLRQNFAGEGIPYTSENTGLVHI
jgi:hypothetical protein